MIISVKDYTPQIGFLVGAFLGVLRVYYGINGGGWIIPRGAAWRYYIGNGVLFGVIGVGFSMLFLAGLVYREAG